MKNNANNTTDKIAMQTAPQPGSSSGDNRAPGGETRVSGGETRVSGGETRAPGGETRTPGGVNRKPSGDNRAPGGDTLVPAGKKRAPVKSVILLCFVVAAAAAFAVCASPLFKITGIEVAGNSYYKKSHLIEKSGLYLGQNGFLSLSGGNAVKIIALRCGGAERAVLSACPYVRSIQARYVPPNTIRIEIEERDKSVIVPYYSSGLLIDDEGVVVDVVRDFRQSGLPVVNGMAVGNYEIGKTLRTAPEDKIESLLLVISALRQADRESGEGLSPLVEAIDVSSSKNITLSLSNGIVVNLGDGAELYYRVSAAKEILAHGIAEGETGTIKFYNGARPVFSPG